MLSNMLLDAFLQILMISPVSDPFIDMYSLYSDVVCSVCTVYP
jgi:hypothetical protein